MKNLETEKDTVQKISSYLLEETIRPAKEKAKELLEEAAQKAKQIQQEAETEKEALLQKAKEEIEQEKRLFHATLHQATEQSLETLRQKVQTHFFSEALSKLVDQEMQKPSFVAKLLEAFIAALNKEGLQADMQILLPKTVKKEEVSKEIAQEALSSLKADAFHLGSMQSGLAIKLVEQKVTLDCTGNTVKELVASFVRRDLRELIFGEGV